MIGRRRRASRRVARRTSRRTARRTSRRVSRRQEAMYDEPAYSEPEYAPPPPPAEPEVDRYDELKKAKELLDSGILTEDEFAAEKARILGE